MYDLGEVSTRQELDFDRLKVVKNGFAPIDSRRLVAPQHLCLIEEPHRYILRSAADMEVVSTEPPITPFWCPSLQRSKSRRMEFYRMLFSVGLLGFRQKANSFVAPFFRRKEGWESAIGARLPADEPIPS
jgi:hypothetical protein